MTYMDHIRKLAEEQYINALEQGSTDDCTGFDFNGQFIINPWLDPTARFPLSTEQAFAVYGEENMLLFSNKIDDGGEIKDK